MMPKKELERWLATLHAEDWIAIDEGGLTLVCVNDPEAYCEVGGIADTYKDEEPQG